MAFIREYSQAGDPFRFRLPKRFKPPRFIRKFQPGRAALRAARMGVGFVPGVGGIADQLLPPMGDPDSRGGFARGYGMIQGDPGRHVPKRKGASAGPRHKAAKKAERRQEKAAGMKRGISSRKHGPSLGQRVKGALGGAIGMIPIAGGLLQGAGLLPGDANQLAAEDPTGGLLQEAVNAGKLAPGHAAAAMKRVHGVGAGGRRRTNPANVKALNRSLHRIEGFEKLAHRVMGHKLFKRVRGSLSSGTTHRSVRGHKSGCGCAVCKRS